MKRYFFIVLPVGSIITFIALHFTDLYLTTKKEIYLLGFSGTLFIGIVVMNGILFFPSLRRGAEPGPWRTIARFFSIYIMVFFVLTLTWFGVELLMARWGWIRLDLFLTMQKSVLASLILAVVVSAVWRFFPGRTH